MGADGIKLLIYYDVDEPDDINHVKKDLVQQVGQETVEEYFVSIRNLNL